jgi:hypothetical protein
MHRIPPPTWLLNEVDDLAQHLQNRFRERMVQSANNTQTKTAPIASIPAASIPAPLLAECERISEMLVEAFSNKCKKPFNTETEFDK